MARKSRALLRGRSSVPLLSSRTSSKFMERDALVSCMRRKPSTTLNGRLSSQVADIFALLGLFFLARALILIVIYIVNRIVY